MLGLIANALLVALKNQRGGQAFDFVTPLTGSLFPATSAQALELAGACVFGAVAGLAVPAYLAARSGGSASTR
jgi:hypothetical protein